MKNIFIIVFICMTTINALTQWPNHDISTLKLLQLVHRHGERSPTDFPPNDPFKSESYWKEGLGELTAKGKYRMYKLGEYIRNEYNDYLGDKYSPREVYVRSSSSHRCIESVSGLLAGAYPPKDIGWQWNKGSEADLGLVWQPLPIETFLPQKEDLILEEGKHCPIVSNETKRIYEQKVIKDFEQKYSELFTNLTKVVGLKVDGIWAADELYDTLKIEVDSGYYWTHVWTEAEERKIVDQLYYSQLMGYRYDWDSPIIKRLRAGGLVRELNNNFNKVLNNTNKQKIYVYSTHGEHMGALMQALNIFNDNIPPFGATLLFELHQHHNSVQNNSYFVRIFYKNDTDIDNTANPHSVRITDCENQFDCPLNQYINSTKHLLYDNFEKECTFLAPDISTGSNGQNISSNPIVLLSLFLVIIMSSVKGRGC